MTRRQSYFCKQKLIGLGVIIMGIIVSLMFGGICPAYIVATPVGLYMIFTRQMVWVDSYYYDVKERRERRGRS